MAAKFKSILPSVLDPGVFQKEFRKAAKEVAAGVKQSFEDATVNFKSNPKFTEFTRVTSTGIYVNVTTDSIAFKYYDLGNGGPTRIIRPTKYKVLRWEADDGTEVFAKFVHGYNGHKISEAIQRFWEKEISDYFDAAIEDGVRNSGHALA